MAESTIKLVQSATFAATVVDFFESATDVWMTREEIGMVLGYVDPAVAIGKIHDRHKDRLDSLSTAAKVVKVEGDRAVERDMFLYSAKGIYEICRWSRQPQADAFFDWVYDQIESIRTGWATSHRPGTLPNISPLIIPPDLPEPLRLVLSATEQAKQAEETEQIDSWISLIADGIDKDLRVAYRRDFVHAGAWLCRNYPWGWDSLVRRLRNSKAVAGWSIRDWREEIDDAVREMDTAQLIRELPDWMALSPQDLQHLLLSNRIYSLIARQGVEWFITLAAEFLDQIYGSDDPARCNIVANMLYAYNDYHQPASRKLKHRVIREQLHAVYLRTHSRQVADLTVGAVWPDAPALIHEWPLPVKSIMGRNYSWTYDDRTISQILGVEENGRPTLRMILSVPMFIVSVQRVPNPKMPSQQFEQLTFVWRTPAGQWVRQSNLPTRLLGSRVTSWLAYQRIASAKSPIFIRDWFYSQRAMVASRLFDSEDAFRDLPLI